MTYNPHTKITVDDDDLFGYRVNFATPIDTKEKEDINSPNNEKPNEPFKVPTKKRNGERQKRTTPYICILSGNIKNDLSTGNLPLFSPTMDAICGAYCLWSKYATNEWYTPKKSKKNPNPTPGWYKMTPHWSYIMWDSDLTNLNEEIPLIPDVGDYAKEVVLMGLTLPLEVIKYWQNKGIKVKIFDFHKLSYFKLKINSHHNPEVYTYGENLTVLLDYTKSACSLSWQFYNSNSSLPKIFKYIQNKANYLLEPLPMEYEITHGISQLKYEGMRNGGIYGVFNALDELFKLESRFQASQIRSYARKRLAEVQQQVLEILPKANVMKYKDIPVLNIELDRDGSQDKLPIDIAHLIFNEMKEEHIGFVACRNSKGEWILYSRYGGNIDVGEIASKNNGQGIQNYAFGLDAFPIN